MFAGYDEYMNRRSRNDVLESHYRFVTINDIGFDLAVDDAAEKTIVHGFPSGPTLSTRR
jgi:hypothetical protein